MKSIAESPHDGELLQSFATWLIERGDRRGDYLQLELDRRETETKLRELERDIRSRELFPGVDLAWLDQVFPLYILSPMVGTWYGAESPESVPFIKIGDHCTPATIVGIIEALLIFSQIPAGKSGVIAEMLVRTGDPVEYGQPLFRIERRSQLLAGG